MSTNKNNYRIVVLLLLQLIQLKAWSQTNKYYSGGINYLYGENINDPPDRSFGKTTPHGLEIFFQNKRVGEKGWEKIYNHPNTGWIVQWIDHQNKFLGQTLALSRSLNVILMQDKLIEFDIRSSLGLVYASEIYRSGTNKNLNYNNAIGQHLNISGQLGLGLSICPTKKLRINLAISLSHISCGALSQPNDGLNLLFVQSGFHYLFYDRARVVYLDPKKSERKKRICFNASTGIGYKQLTSENEAKYALGSVYLYADKRLTEANAVNLGFEFFINAGAKREIEKDAMNNGKDFKQIGISAGHEWIIDKFGVLTNMGYLIYCPYPPNTRTYQKLAFKYYFSDKLFAAATLRAYKLRSDEATFGIGVRL